MSPEAALEAEPELAQPAGPAVQPLDFSQPTKFTPELRRRIERVVGAFCKATSVRLTGDLGVPVELTRTAANQLSWSAARASLGPDPLLVALTVNPIGRQMLLSLEQPMMMRALCCMLGGSADTAPVQRKLSDIDWALARRLLDGITLQLSLVWRDLGGLELAVSDVDTEGDAGVFLPIGEPTLAIELECTLASASSRLVLLLPWSAIEPVASQILDRGEPTDGGDPEQARALEQGLARTKTLVRAEIGSATVAVEEVLALAPGSLLRLDRKAEDGVRLLAHQVMLARGLPGRSGVRKAVKLITPIQPHSEIAARRLSASPPASAPKPALELGAMRERIGQLRTVDLRVWAELGSTEIELGNALSLPQGSVLELDQDAEEAVALFVNGVCFASGTLVVTDDGRWAVEVGALR